MVLEIAEREKQDKTNIVNKSCITIMSDGWGHHVTLRTIIVNRKQKIKQAGNELGKAHVTVMVININKCK